VQGLAYDRMEVESGELEHIVTSRAPLCLGMPIIDRQTQGPNCS
jgi:hypothetical protein